MKMSKLTLCLLFSLASLAGFSQKVYFVYLQTEDEQTFFAKMNGRVHSSSASGYLILSKLRDTTYNIAVGFPQNKWAEQNFSISINKKDHGYLLKNFGEKGWGLFDLQTLTVQMALSGSAKIEDRKLDENKDVSVFTEILSKASDDPSLKEKAAKPEMEGKKPATTIDETVSKGDSKEMAKDSLALKPVEIIAKTEERKAEQKNETQEQVAVKVEENLTPTQDPYKPTVVIKRSESSTTEGFGLVFIDDNGNGSNDTIRLLIPNPKPVVNSINDEPKDEKRFVEILPDSIKKKDEKAVDTIATAGENIVTRNTRNNNCPAIAQENDFFKLRKNMAAAEGDDNMIKEARYYFKAKCFTTEQIRNLGFLFLDEDSKYKFFDLAYSHVTDKGKFNVLQNELKEEKNINRFIAMLSN